MADETTHGGPGRHHDRVPRRTFREADSRPPSKRGNLSAELLEAAQEVLRAYHEDAPDDVARERRRREEAEAASAETRLELRHQRRTAWVRLIVAVVTAVGGLGLYGRYRDAERTATDAEVSVARVEESAATAVVVTRTQAQRLAAIEAWQLAIQAEIARQGEQLDRILAAVAPPETEPEPAKGKRR